MNSQILVLASTSHYRSELLSRLQIPFQTASPDVDETPLNQENARQTSLRLSRAKAEAIAALYPNALIIGSDQVVLLGDKQLGKPLTHEKAVTQLRELRGQTVTFFTALSLLNASTGNMQTDVAINNVSYRNITDEQIESYLRKEQPYQCAGSIKSEGLGIALLNSIEGEDPNALVGLPLILLVNMLLRQGVKII